MKTRLSLVLFILVALATRGSAEGLLVNGNGEAGSLEGWRCVEGEFQAIDHPADQSYAGPASGRWYFFGGRGPRSVLEQTVAVPSDSVGRVALLRAKLQGIGGDGIAAELAILDEDGRLLAERAIDAVTDPNWRLCQTQLLVPKAAAALRVRLVATRAEGQDIDGYADDLSLVVQEYATRPVDQQILLGPTLTAITSTSVMVWWHTQAETDAHRVKYGRTRMLGRTIEVGKWTQYPRARIEGLKPGLDYYYQVESDHAESKICSLQTIAPDDAFRIALWSDNQIGFETFGNVIVPLVRKLDPAVALVPGDVVEDGKQYSHWAQHLYQPAAELLNCVPWFPARGNHDGESILAQQMLPLPNNNRWYAQMLGPVRLVVLDTNVDFGPKSEQTRWLEDEVAGPVWKEAKYRIVSFHKPPFTSLWDDPDYDGEPTGRSTLVPLLEGAGADLVVCGHAHAYQRGERVRPDGGKTRYLILGGAGGALDTVRVFPWPFISITEPRHHVVTADVYKNEIRLQAIDATTERVFDRWTVPASR
jgi:hypothetical protein